MGRFAQYKLGKLPVGVILKGHTRISAFTFAGRGLKEVSYIMSYQSDLDLALNTSQYWRSNPMMLDSTSISRHGADYNFPPEGVLLYFFIDVFSKELEFPPIIEIHTEIGDKGDGF